MKPNLSSCVTHMIYRKTNNQVNHDKLSAKIINSHLEGFNKSISISVVVQKKVEKELYGLTMRDGSLWRIVQLKEK